MNARCIDLLKHGLVVLLVLTGCENTTLDNDTDGESESVYTVFHSEDGLADNSITDLAVDYIRDGVWFATRNGISFYSNADSLFYTFGAEYDIPDMEVLAIEVDNTGTVWAGTVSGVSSLSLGDSLWTWAALADMDSLVHRYITDIAVMDDFSVWFGTRGGVSVRTFWGAWRHYTTEIGPSVEITAIAGGDAGQTWVGTTNGVGVFDGETWSGYGAGILPSTYVHALYKDSIGVMWCGTASIITAYNGVSWTNYGPADGLPSSGIYDITQDSTGMVWAATGKGVYYFTNGKWVSFSLPAEAASAAARAISIDRRTDVIWIGTDSGAVRFSP